MMDITAYQTPFKYSHSVLKPSRVLGAFDQVAVDVPFVFSHNGKVHMMYVGFDGIGYQTALAQADNPLGPFQTLGVILSRGQGNGWDSRNAAGVWIISDQDLFGTRKLKKIDGKYWMYYHSYPEDGYEAGPAAIGMAWCEEEDLMTWHRMPEPILTIENGASWEAGGLYKNCLVEKDGKYYLFYNAKNSPGDGSFWKEQIGVAVGDSPFQFVRWKGNPLLRIEPKKWDSCFCSDPWVVWDKNQWVMFYYGFDGQHAMDGIAVSQDLLHWEKAPEPILRYGAPGELDDLHAHKPALYWENGVLYHYYCCCKKEPEYPPYFEKRAIAVACSEKVW